MNKNLMYKVLVIILIAISMLLIGTIEAKAAGTSLTATKQNAYVGDDVKINLSFTAAAWNLKISGNGIVGKSYAAQTSDLSEANNGDSFTLNTSSAGTYTIILTGDITDQNGVTTDVNKKVTVVVETKPEPTPQPTPEPTPQPTPEPTPEPTPQQPSNTGSNDNSSSNTNSTPKSNNANLKSLWVKPSEYDFTGFKANNLQYTAKDVPNEVEKITIGAILESEKAKIVSGTGSVNLKVGLNEIPIKVEAEDGTEKTYIIKITRKEAEEEEEEPEEVEPIVDETIGLSTLTIEGLKLSPDFDSKIYNYTANLTENLNKLDIKFKATLENSKVEITGNENLKDGENIITIIVTSDNTEEIATYQIVLNKEVSGVIADTTGSNTDNIDLEPIIEEKENGINKLVLIIAAILVILVIIILIILKNKNSRNKDKQDDYFEEDVEELNINNKYEEFTSIDANNPLEEQEKKYSINSERDNNSVERIFGKKGKHS